MIKHAHSGFRWIVLLLLIYAIVNAFGKKNSAKAYTSGDKKINLFAMTAIHIQMLIGLAAYFVSPKVIFAAETMKHATSRFFTVEHSVMMLLGTILITIGYSKAKRAEEDQKKFKTVFIFYLIGLLIILAGIPWPFRTALGGGWF